LPTAHLAYEKGKKNLDKILSRHTARQFFGVTNPDEINSESPYLVRQQINQHTCNLQENQSTRAIVASPYKENQTFPNIWARHYQTGGLKDREVKKRVDIVVVRHVKIFTRRRKKKRSEVFFA
jgi:hypothetical protein